MADEYNPEVEENEEEQEFGPDVPTFKPIWNLEEIKKEAVFAEPEDDFDGGRVKMVYLGSVFSLYPSGKFYTPFACSNVELCPKCKGEGCDYCGHQGSREAHEDEIWREEAEEELATIGAYLVSGEGDPCDLFAAFPCEEEEEVEDDEEEGDTVPSFQC